MSADAPQFELERFERAKAVSGTVRLQIAGRWRADEVTRLTAPILLLGDGRQTRRFAPLPGAVDVAAGPDPPRWRVAYSAPAALLAADHVTFSLETSVSVVDLPRPQRAGPQQPAEAAEPKRARATKAVGPALLTRERRRRERAELLAEERQQAITALEQRLAKLTDERDGARAQIGTLADTLAGVRAERGEVERERDGVLAEVERLTALLGRSHALDEPPDADLARLELERALASALKEVDRLSALGRALGADLEDALEDVNRATEQIAGDERERLELEQRLDAAILATAEATQREQAEAAARKTLEERMAKLATSSEQSARQAELARRAAARAASRAALAARVEAAEQAEARAEQRALEQQARAGERAAAAREAIERGARRRAEDDQRRAAADSLRRRQEDAVRGGAEEGRRDRTALREAAEIAARPPDDDVPAPLPPRAAPVPLSKAGARSRERAARTPARSNRLPSQVVVGVLLALIAGAAVILFILGLLHVTVTG